MSLIFLSNLIIFVLSIIFFSANIIYKDKLAKKLNIIDKIDKNKIHEQDTSLNGAFHILFIINLSLLFNYFLNKDFDLLLIVIGVNFFFILGFLDDKYNLNANLKLLISALFVFFIISISQNLKLEHLYSELFSKKYVIKSFSPYFTTLCILLLINAVNLADGINSLVNNIVTIWLINLVLVFGLNLNFSIFVIIFFLILNSYFIFKNYYFLGDSGTLSLGFFISLITIYSYNQNLYLSFSLEDMFLIFMIPGIDMFRLFIKRIIKKTNPFSGDKNHLHHILLNKFGLLKANLIYVLFIIFPLIMNNFFTDFTVLVIIISLITYGYFLTFKKKFFKPL